ncbi:hypothetical protein, partial [Bacillus wiedmannii]
DGDNFKVLPIATNRKQGEYMDKMYAFQIATTLGILVMITLNIITGQEVRTSSIVVAAVCCVGMFKFNPLFREIIDKYKK